MKYKFLPKIATADIAFEAYSKTLEELFQNSALALMAVMVDVKTVKSVYSLQFTVYSKNLEELLFDFLSELVFLKDSQNSLFSKFDIKLHFNTAQYYSKKYRLETTVWGEKIDPEHHKLRADVKAITWHLFKIGKTKAGYKAQVVVDI